MDIHGRQQIYTPQLSSGDCHTTQKTAPALQSTGRIHTASAATITPRFLVPDQLRRETLTISCSVRMIHSEFLWSKWQGLVTCMGKREEPRMTLASQKRWQQ